MSLFSGNAIHILIRNISLFIHSGLDDSLTRYVEHLKTADVVGEQLLSLTSEDLQNLQIHLVGHQEQILEAVSLLQQLV